MQDNCFIDTNIWVYAKIRNSNEPKHNKARIFLSEVNSIVFINTQVVNEFYNVLNKNSINDEIIQRSIEEILKEAKVNLISLNTIRQSWYIKTRYNISVFDSIIVSSALETKSKVLFSEDMQHKQIIEDKLQIINPFMI